MQFAAERSSQNKSISLLYSCSGSSSILWINFYFLLWSYISHVDEIFFFHSFSRLRSILIHSIHLGCTQSYLAFRVSLCSKLSTGQMFRFRSFMWFSEEWTLKNKFPRNKDITLTLYLKRKTKLSAKLISHATHVIQCMPKWDESVARIKVKFVVISRWSKVLAFKYEWVHRHSTRRSGQNETN